MKSSFIVLALAAATSSAWAQAPSGPEFQVNAFTTGDQTSPAAAGLPGGRFLATWVGASQDGDGWGVVARRLDASGARLGAEFVVNQYTTGDQSQPTVAATPDGRALIAWTSNGQDGSAAGVFARGYNPTGEPLGPEFQVNTFTSQGQDRPKVAAIPGGFLVVWQSAGQDGAGLGAFGRVYGLDAQPVSPEFQLSVETSGDQHDPVAAGMPDGGYVVAWIGPITGFGSQVFVRRFTPAGPSGPETGVDIQVGPYDFCEYPALTADTAGRFTVGWRSLGGWIGVSWRFWEVGLRARLYDPSGVPLGNPFTVDQAPNSWALQSAFSNAPGARTLLAWTSSTGQFSCSPTPCPPQDAQDGSGRSVYARWFEDGSPISSEFRVNTYTTDDQQWPAVAIHPYGNALIVWQSPQDGSGTGIFGQRFGRLAPAAMTVDPAAGPASDGNGVLEPGETAEIAPAWRNVTGASQGFGGSAVSFTGPAGPIYGLTDALADYGVVADGALGSCRTPGDCYSASLAGTRPLTHWDASLSEILTPTALGTTAAWSVHVGDSFSDVPRSSPFYRFVETLLHKGVTGGCAADAYCPSSAVTREQLSVFVLVAKQGAGYAPGTCATPVFGDVPASSPFCRWIQELARRGVVSGCGDGNYCPTNPVSREQMPVFVLRVLDPALDPPACTTPAFSDVPASSPYCRFIEELARRGVVGGCGGGNYCPSDPVTREQMAVFLSSTFGLTLYGP